MCEKLLFDRIIAVTNRQLCRRPFLDQVAKICEQKPRALLLREKDLAEEDYRALAWSVWEICRDYQVELIPHTFVKVAAELHTEKVHLPLARLRKLAGRPLLEQFKQIGTSVHSTAELEEAMRLGAGYVTAGHIYETDCKMGLPPRGLSFLKAICALSTVPVWGIGGIGLEKRQMDEVIEAGACGACVMSKLMNDW